MKIKSVNLKEAGFGLLFFTLFFMNKLIKINPDLTFLSNFFPEIGSAFNLYKSLLNNYHEDFKIYGDDINILKKIQSELLEVSINIDQIDNLCAIVLFCHIKKSTDQFDNANKSHPGFGKSLDEMAQFQNLFSLFNSEEYELLEVKFKFGKRDKRGKDQTSKFCSSWFKSTFTQMFDTYYKWSHAKDLPNKGKFQSFGNEKKLELSTKEKLSKLIHNYLKNSLESSDSNITDQECKIILKIFELSELADGNEDLSNVRNWINR